MAFKYGLLGVFYVVLLALSALADDIDDKDAQPLTPPVPNYPMDAMMKGLSGACDVLFDIDKSGKPINVGAACTNKIFCESAIDSVRRVEFSSKVIDGEAAVRLGVVYPMTYRVNDVPLPNTPLKSCKEDPIS